MGLEYLVIVFFFGLATAIFGKIKGSSFFIWFLVGAVMPILGLIAVSLYRVEKDEPERQCPTCTKALKLYVQVCPTVRDRSLPAGSGCGAAPGRAVAGLSLRIRIQAG